MRTLTIVYGEKVWGGWHLEVIDECGRTSEQLCFGEMLEQVAGLTHRNLGRAPYAMHTPEEWERRSRESIARGEANRAASLSRLGCIEKAAARLHAINVAMDAENQADPPDESEYQAAMAEMHEALALPA
jgi:hypothetical protein